MFRKSVEINLINNIRADIYSFGKVCARILASKKSGTSLMYQPIKKRAQWNDSGEEAKQYEILRTLRKMIKVDPSKRMNLLTFIDCLAQWKEDYPNENKNITLFDKIKFTKNRNGIEDDNIIETSQSVCVQWLTQDAIKTIRMLSQVHLCYLFPHVHP